MAQEPGITNCSGVNRCPECGAPTNAILEYIKNVVDPELAQLRAERDRLVKKLLLAHADRPDIVQRLLELVGHD